MKLHSVCFGSARDRALCAASLALFAATLSIATLAAGHSRSDRIAAVFPPWWSSERALAAALAVGPVSGSGGLPFVVGVRGASPDIATRLRAAGAWLTLDGSRFSFCLSSLRGG